MYGRGRTNAPSLCGTLRSPVTHTAMVVTMVRPWQGLQIEEVVVLAAVHTLPAG